MARTAQVPSLTSEQALYVLQKVIAEGKVTAADVRRHLEINHIEERLSELRSVAQGAKHPIRALRRILNKVKRAKRNLSAKARASYRLQGQYVGYIKQIPEKVRPRFKQLAKQEGREKAVAAMKK